VRLVFAALVTLSVLAAAVSPHAHAGGLHAGERCAACVVRAADAVSLEIPDLEPTDVPAGEAAAAPGLSPVTGAPLGAIPGQSPPAAA
jgi:hypothetical protein